MTITHDTERERKHMLAALRSGKSARDEEGTVDQHEDSLLARAEAGDWSWSRYLNDDCRFVNDGQPSDSKDIREWGTDKPVRTVKPDLATDAQIRYIHVLINLKFAPGLRAEAHAKLNERHAAGEFTKRAASDTIENAKSMADWDGPAPEPEHSLHPSIRAEKAKQTEVEPGMYRIGERIFKVQIAVHGSGRPYAKELIRSSDGPWSFEYAQGAIRDLKPEHRMTVEQAKEWGALYGTCCVCGRTLTDETSIAAGIGPVCGGRV